MTKGGIPFDFLTKKTNPLPLGIVDRQDTTPFARNLYNAYPDATYRRHSHICPNIVHIVLLLYY